MKIPRIKLRMTFSLRILSGFNKNAKGSSRKESILVIPLKDLLKSTDHKDVNEQNIKKIKNKTINLLK